MPRKRKEKYEILSLHIKLVLTKEEHQIDVPQFTKSAYEKTTTNQLLDLVTYMF